MILKMTAIVEGVVRDNGLGLTARFLGPAQAVTTVQSTRVSLEALEGLGSTSWH